VVAGPVAEPGGNGVVVGVEEVVVEAEQTEQDRERQHDNDDVAGALEVLEGRLRIRNVVAGGGATQARVRADFAGPSHAAEGIVIVDLRHGGRDAIAGRESLQAPVVDLPAGVRGGHAGAAVLGLTVQLVSVPVALSETNGSNDGYQKQQERANRVANRNQRPLRPCGRRTSVSVPFGLHFDGLRHS